ncbi:MAG: tetratricopeptide repeat protein [Ferruginibacter sp.]
MADKQVNKKNNPVTNTSAVETETLAAAKGFWDKYSRPIIYVGGSIIILLMSYLSYKEFVVAPNELKASEQIFGAENIFDKMAATGFNKDSVNLVINGGQLEGKKVTGMLTIINQFGGTKAGNRAKFIAGASYLQIGEFDKAIKYLSDFNGNGATQAESKAYTMIGHAYAEQKKTTNALNFYKKAAEVLDPKDQSFGGDALLLAATYADAIGNSKEAVDLFKQIQTKYPTSPAVSNGDVDKYLAKYGEVE